MKVMFSNVIAFKGIAGGGRNNDYVECHSNYYVGCTGNPSYKPKSECSLRQNVFSNIERQFGTKEAEAVDAAARGGASNKVIATMIKSFRK